jgi:hypothetical protein
MAHSSSNSAFREWGGESMSSSSSGPVFEPVKDVAFFRNFTVAEYGTIAWSNGADLAPEFLYAKAHVPTRG